MDLSGYQSNIENWFLKRQKCEFPNNVDYVTQYKSIKDSFQGVLKEVTLGANATDETSLTWHDESHNDRVIVQASKLLSYDLAKITAYETFILLVAIQIHDIMNIMGRIKHEDHAIAIFKDLGIAGLLKDNFLVQTIGAIAMCHSGSVLIGQKEEKDKISMLALTVFTGDKKVHMRFLAALLRLADEYADESNRAMSFLLKYKKIKDGSIIHHRYAESLADVEIQPDTGISNYDFHIDVKNVLIEFPKFIKQKNTFEQVYLLDEIFERTMKSHYETIYCMRYLRPYISINKIHVSITIEHAKPLHPLILAYELEEKGYPNNDEYTILDLIDKKTFRLNGNFWNGKNLKDYILKHSLTEV